MICIVFVLLLLLVSNISLKHRPIINRIHSNSRIHSNTRVYSTKKDYYDDFTLLDKILFDRFSNSVVIEMNTNSNTNTIYKSPKSYQELIDMINLMTLTRPSKQVNNQAKNMLVRLFPYFILEQFRWMFAKPFPAFSYWMNAWVTHYTTNWLMGNSTIIDIELSDGTVGKEQGINIYCHYCYCYCYLCYYY